MQRINIAALGITLAVASTAIPAASFDATRGTYDTEIRSQQPLLEAAPERSESAIAEERTASVTQPEFIPIVPREYLAPESQINLAQAPRYDPRHPQSGQLNGRGLFNRAGPNDFGA